ncbi:MAG: hypothetical protein ACOYMG_24065, partial [Candidatus Methylumidiphilus sp.]
MSQAILSQRGRIAMLACFCLNLLLVPHWSAAGDLTIYSDDALINNWQDWSWDSSRDFSSTDYAHTGTRSVKVTYASAWAGFRLEHPSLCTAPYARLNFWVNGGTQAGRNIRVSALISGVSKTSVPLDNY